MTILGCIILQTFITAIFAQSKKKFSVIAYYAGGPEKADSVAAEKLTHIIYSFGHLNGSKLYIQTAKDSLTIIKLVALKTKNPELKVLLSLGGWGGCETCSAIFSLQENRLAFAQSVKELNDYFHSDGIDLDWEFPTLLSLPGHGYKPEDKQNFTFLVQQLRKILGPKMEISFAAGGFKWTLRESIEWKPVMQLVNRVNLMSYDFLPGDATGHHTALFSTTAQKSSADYFIKYLLELGVPANKIVLGAAFYARKWDSIPSIQNGLYQKGKTAGAIAYKELDERFPEAAGYERFWDSTASAPFIYNASLQQFISYDNVRSVQLKTKYLLKNKLNGIMFWQLAQDKLYSGLLDAIYDVKISGRKVKPVVYVP